MGKGEKRKVEVRETRETTMNRARGREEGNRETVNSAGVESSRSIKQRNKTDCNY